MRERYDNIFNNVVKYENQTTELLRNFLQFKLFRDVFLQLFLVDDEVIDSIGKNDLRTQVSLRKKGMPDLVIENDRVKIFFEIKINDADLTENQPAGYFEYLSSLKDGIEKWLVFIIPRDYRNEGILRRRISGCLTPDTINDVNIRILYWRDIVNAMESSHLIAMSALFVEFHSLLKSWFIPTPIIFSNEEVTVMFDRRMPEVLTKLMEFVDSVRKRVKSYDSEWSVKDYEYGIYFKNDEGDRMLFFGIWYPYWKKYAKPICYCVDRDNYDQKVVLGFIQFFENEYVDFDDEGEVWHVASVEEKTYCSDDSIFIVSKKIEELLNIMNE
jgi:hypothetical protein